MFAAKNLMPSMRGMLLNKVTKIFQADLSVINIKTTFPTNSLPPSLPFGLTPNRGLHWRSSNLQAGLRQPQKTVVLGNDLFIRTATRTAYADFSFPRKFNYWLTVYKQLAKFRLSALVVSTSAAGFVLGSDNEIDWEGVFWVSLGTMMASSCANTFNQISEIKFDKMMKRTMMRPLPSSRISPLHALAFGATMGVAGVSILAYKNNELTAMLGAANIWLYAGIYTPLKQISVVNTWMGAVVGAIPPLMGWAAARGQLDLQAGVLGAVLYFWQLPHFLALAWMFKDDYALGRHRMLPIVDRTGMRTAASALRNCIYLLPVGALAYAVGLTTLPFAVENAAVTAYMGFYAVKFYRDPSYNSARMLFRSSLMHLPLLMGLMILHRIPQPAGEELPVEMPDCLPDWVKELRSVPVISWMLPSESVTMDTANAKTSIAEVKASGAFTFDAPFPFISVPPFPSSIECPSKVTCEKEEANSMKTQKPEDEA